MTTYTGPVPPPPGPQADAPTWANWWAYQNLLLQLRYEDERASRAAVTDVLTRAATEAQEARALAEEHVASAGFEGAAAQRALVAAMTKPAAPWTDEELVRTLMLSMVDTVSQGTAAAGRALAYKRALRALFPPAEAIPTPEGGPDSPPTPQPPKQGNTA
jgi:hypothetical protein